MTAARRGSGARGSDRSPSARSPAPGARGPWSETAAFLSGQGCADDDLGRKPEVPDRLSEMSPKGICEGQVGTGPAGSHGDRGGRCRVGNRTSQLSGRSDANARISGHGSPRIQTPGPPSGSQPPSPGEGAKPLEHLSAARGHALRQAGREAVEKRRFMATKYTGEAPFLNLSHLLPEDRANVV